MTCALCRDLIGGRCPAGCGTKAAKAAGACLRCLAAKGATHAVGCPVGLEERQIAFERRIESILESGRERLLEIQSKRDAAPLPTNLDAPATTAAAVGEYERGIADTLQRLDETLDDVAKQHGTMGDLVIDAVKEALAARGLVVGATVRVGGEG